jgi:citrate lyase subunit beta/citryl-CoA lyase
MMQATHPTQALFQGEKALPSLPVCEHYAGDEKRILKAFELQAQLGPVFDVTCDCEDGAPVGREREHAETLARMLASAANRFDRAGVRVHGFDHTAWQQDLDIVIGSAGDRLAYITIPKPASAAQAGGMIEYSQHCIQRSGSTRPIPVHVLIETQGALREIWEIASLPGVETLDFGLLDFVSDHRGAIPASAMRSPGQFEHKLVARAKAEIAAAALANALVPSHNICMELNDTEVIAQDARRAREDFGFLRMYSIHPRQIQPIVDAMKPGLDEVALASEILLQAQRANWGPIRYGNDMHDRASYRYFWQVLQNAKACAVPIAADAERAFFN